MFGFLKDKAFASAYLDLNNCLQYLQTEIDANAREKAAEQILNTIHEQVKLITNGSVTAGQVSQHFTKFKNDIMASRALRDHRDIEFSGAYILRCFFQSMHNPDRAYAKLEALKIIDFCEKNIGRELASSDYMKKRSGPGYLNNFSPIDKWIAGGL